MHIFSLSICLCLLLVLLSSLLLDVYTSCCCCCGWSTLHISKPGSQSDNRRAAASSRGRREGLDVSQKRRRDSKNVSKATPQLLTSTILSLTLFYFPLLSCVFPRVVFVLFPFYSLSPFRFVSQSVNLILVALLFTYTICIYTLDCKKKK